MSDEVLLVSALACETIGFGWLALAMDIHWQQVTGTDALPRATGLRLRWSGAIALIAGLVLCLAANHPSMAILVWITSLPITAFIVAQTLTWLPRALAILVI